MRYDLSVSDALAAVLATARLVGTESVPLADAAGRILARDVEASEPIPPFHTSAMDGYAVRAVDCSDPPLALPVVGASVAGAAPEADVSPGVAVAIATGAPLPEGADAIVPVEWTRRDGDRVHIDRAPEAGRYIRRAGSALASGEAPLEAGDRLTPPALGLLSAMGVGAVDVRQRPRVRLVITGDEVTPPDVALAPGGIRDTNGPALSAQIEASGGRATVVYARDEPGAIADAASGDTDVLVLTGGVSVGPRDLVQSELEAAGAEWRFWRVRQRPGKPLLFGLWDGVPVLGLPGNPVSASVGWEIYGRPLLAAMLGRSPDPILLPARLATPLPTARGLHTFARVVARRDATGAVLLSSAGSQGSHVYRTMLGTGLAHLPAGWDAAPEGSDVLYQPFAWSPPC